MGLTKTITLLFAAAIVCVYVATPVTKTLGAEHAPVVQGLSGSINSGDWVRQHPIESGWMLFSVSVVDSLHAWASGWHDSAAGLVVRTTDGGENWFEMTRTLPLYLNDIHFVTDSLGWVVGGSAFSPYTGFIHRTTDGGLSWPVQFSDPHNRFWSVFFLDDMRGWVCGDSGKILATTDGGVNWQTQESGRRTSFQDVFFFSNGTGWCGGSIILRTTNFGAQWDSISNIRLKGFSFLNDSLGWAVPGDAALYWTTTSGGRTWTQIFEWSNVYPTDVVALDDSLVLATIWDSRVDPPFDYFPMTLGNLTSFPPPIETRAGPPLWGIDFAKSGHGFAVGDDDIVSSRDSGRTWRNQTGAPRGGLASIDMVDSSTGWVVGDKELIMRTTDGGIHWKAQSPAGSGFLWAVASIDEQHAFAAGSVFMSTSNGGKTWLRTPTPGNYTVTDLSFLDSQKGWATTLENRVLRTTNGGNSWAEQSVPGRHWAIDFVDTGYGWCTGEYGAIYKTTNGGLSWSLGGLSTMRNLRSIDFLDRNYGWVAGEHIILRTTDGGTHWDTSDVSIHAGYRAVHFVNRDTGWAVGAGSTFGGRGRIVATTNGGESWMVQRAGGTPDDLRLYSIDAVSSHNVWISGDYGEILHTTNGGGITTVEGTGGEVPSQFELGQNYPNPFNPTTTIKFDLPELAIVSLAIYDVLGRKVSELVSGSKEAGYHSTVWNASGVASGVYFARFTATDMRGNVKLNKVSKLLLAK